MRWVTIMFLLALCLPGSGPLGEPVSLLTGVDGCYAGGETGVTGPLLADPEYGTSLNGMPVMWPVGFTGLRLPAGEVEVRDSAGTVVAMTGRRYHISIGPVMFSSEKHQFMERIGAFPAAANCGYAWDFVDCGSPAGPSTRSEAARLYCS